MPISFTSEVLKVSPQAVYKYQNSENLPFSKYVSELVGFGNLIFTKKEIPRNRLGERETFLLKWLEQNCPVPSGRAKRYLFF